MDDLNIPGDAGKREEEPSISPEETQHRREHFRVAIADNRIEGIATSAATQEIFDSYIRGEIEAGDLVTAYVKRPWLRPANKMLIGDIPKNRGQIRGLTIVAG